VSELKEVEEGGREGGREVEKKGKEPCL